MSLKIFADVDRKQTWHICGSTPTIFATYSKEASRNLFRKSKCRRHGCTLGPVCYFVLTDCITILSQTVTNHLYYVGQNRCLSLQDPPLW
jgi:hypothetical protein